MDAQQEEIKIHFCIFSEDAENFDNDIKMRIETNYSFACVSLKEERNKLNDKNIWVFPRWIAHKHKTDFDISNKITYSIIHELIHILGDSDRENYVHALAMLLTDTTEYNNSGYGKHVYNDIKKCVVKI